jgi:selenocysteine-specific elongation factor
MAIHLILGTAGHIDHGKTALVRALTGVDTDRLPEEKKRGITIDLGFAELPLSDYRLGIVDVPGHERFVRNMLAGATGIDLAMLAVAADDSVKPQTREHLEILRLLNLRSGVIALTKCDTAEPDWIELVEAEVRDLVRDSFLADAPIVQTSAFTGAGIKELKEELHRAADSLGPFANRSAGPFRMAVDGVFSIAGHGTVVRGSVLRGCVAADDELEIHPTGNLARVRSLQNHGRDVSQLERGQRAAINLAGVHHDEISRGSELASRGLLRPARLLTVELSLLPTFRRPLRHRQRIRLHLGTAQLLANVLLRQAHEIAPGQSGLAQLLLDKSVTTTWGQPFVVRSESPVQTIGGGRVLAPDVWKFRRGAEADWEEAENLRSVEMLTRGAAAVYFRRWDDWRVTDLARCAGADDPDDLLEKLLADPNTIQEFDLSPTRTLRIHHRHVTHLESAMVAALQRLHDENPRDLVIPQSQLAAHFRFLETALFKMLLERLVQEGRIEMMSRGVALPGQGPQLSKKETQLLGEIVNTYRNAGLRPPFVEEIRKQAAHNQEAVPQLIQLAEARGELVRVSNSFYLHTDVTKQLRELLEQKFSGSTGFTVSELREQLDISRKYAIPLCEYLDRIRFTRRQGDLRVLVKGSED